MAAVAVLAMSAFSPAVSAATSAVHEMTVNWVGAPAGAPYGSAVTAEWHVSTNDASNPQANNPVNNVRLTLTATNGTFASIPPVCKTTGVTPPSAISANGTQLLCNVGTVTEGTATVVQAQVMPSGTVGSALSLSGSATSDSAAAPTAPAATSGLTITGTHGMDLALSAPNQNYQQSTVTSRSGGNRPSVMVDYGISMTAGSVPGPSTYTFTVDIAVSVAGQLPGLQWEGCAPVDDSAQAIGIPYSASSFANRTNVPTCSISGSGTHYTVTLSGLDYTLQHVPTVDSIGNAIPSTTDFIASGQLIFSYTSAITASTGVNFTATPSPFTFIDSVTQPETNTANDASGTTLVLPGTFSIAWFGGPTTGRSPWDANLWAAPGTAQNLPLPVPGAGTSTNPGRPVSGLELPLVSQADSVAWSTYTGPGGADVAGSCGMFQNPAAFTPRYADTLGADGASYSKMTTAHLWYRTDVINTKSETCGEPVGVAGSPWISAPFPAGCASQPLNNVVYSDDLCIVNLPAGVTAVKMTWDPAVDKQTHHFLRVWGYVPQTAPIGAESWTVGAFNAPYNVATVFPGYPNLNNYTNISTNPSVTANIPGSTYGPNTNGIRDAMRIQGPNGVITKTASTQSVLPGVPVTYTLSAESDLAVSSPPNQTFTVTDTLPAGMTYVAGSGTPVPSLSVNGSGQQVLTYTFTNVPANTPQPITYQAQTAANSTVAPGTVLTNTAQINVPGDNRVTAAKQTTASGTVPNSGATTLGKSVESATLSFYGASSAWDLTINSFDSVSSTFTDTIDILPNTADGRGTNISGSYAISGVTVPAGATIYYSTAAVASLSNDPRAASNGGTPGSVTGNTVGWTTTKPATPTAIRVIGPALAPGAAQTIRIAFTTPTGTSCTAPASTDNKPGQVMVNSANTIAQHTGLPMLSSSTTTIGNCYALGIVKYVLAKGGNPANPADYHDANIPSDYQSYYVGDTIPYKIVITNLSTGALTNISVTDAIAPSCNFVAASLAPNVSQTQTCTGTASAAGTLINTANASATPASGPALSASDVAGVTVTAPTISLKKSLAGNRFAAADQFTVAIRTGSASGTVVNSTTNSTTAGTGSTVTAGSGTTGTYTATAGTTYYLTEAITSSTPLSKYTTNISCTDLNNVQTGLPNGAFSGSATITPVNGAAISCTLTNASIGVSTLFKNAKNLANSSTSDSRTSTTGTAVPGDTIQWVVNYSNNSGANATVNISDLITGGQIYVPGSLKVPPSLSMQYTTNSGGTWTTGTPPAGANGVGALTTGSNRVAGVNSGTSALAPPFLASTLTFNTPGGDGYSVEGFGNNIYTVFHHNNSATVVFCATLSNTVCPGWPAYSTYVSPVAGTPLGTGGAGQSSTAGVNGSFINKGKLYWPVHMATAVGGVYPVGLQCLNLTSLVSCGFIQLDTVALASGGLGIAGDGVQAANGKYYYADINGSLLCFDPTVGANGASCGVVNGGTGAETATSYSGYFAEFGTYGNYVYFTYSWNGNNYLFGYNVSGATPTIATAQYTGPVQSGPNPSEVLPVVSSTGTVLGACAVYNSVCYSTSNTAIPNPWTATQYSFSPSPPAAAPGFGFGTGVLIGTKYYVTIGSTSTNCYDFAARVGNGPVPACTGFAGPASLNSYTVRPLANLPGCMAANGDGAKIVVFSQTTGGSCVSASTTVTKTTPTSYYCDGGTHVSNWDRLTLVGLTGSEYASATVTLYDANGNPVPGFINIVMSGTTLDISSLAVSGNTTSLGASVTLTGVTNTAAVNAASAALSWSGDPMQMCYQTVVPPVSCLTTAPVSDVANVVTTAGSLTDGPGGTSSGTTSFTAAPTATQCQLNFAKTASAPAIQPGGGLTYTITVTNNGTMPYSAAAPASFTDDLTNVLAGAAYSDNLTASAGTASYAAPVLSWSGPLAAGATATIKYTVTANPNPPATMTNTVVTPDPSNCPSAACTVVVPPTPQVNIQKSTPATTLTPNGTIVYTIVASNVGSVSAAGTVVSDPIPTGIASQTWTCAASGGAACPNASGSGGLNETLATFPAGSAVTYTVTATVSGSPPAQVANTATATPPIGSVCKPDNTPPPCKSTVIVPPVPQVSIQKSTPATTLTPGGTITYTIVASNVGAVSAAGTVVADPIPSGIASQTWTCAASGGAACPNASGAGGLSETLATFPAGSAVTYTVTATVVGTNPPAHVTNTATATPPNGSVCEPNNTQPPCHSTVTVPPVPQIGITKTANVTTLTPGGTVVYTIVVSNTGSVDASGTVAADPIPTGIASQGWSCAASGGAVCPNASGTGALSQTLATFPAGSAVTYTVTATVAANPPAQVTNTAAATPPAGGVCTPSNTAGPCTATVTLAPNPQVSIQKSTTATTLTPNGTIVYTIVASNTGSVSAAGTVVADPIPTGIAGQTWTCTPSGGTVCPNVSGNGALSETLANFPAGSAVTYTVTATVSSNPPAHVTNTATATPPTGSVCTPGNTQPPCHSTVTVPPVPQVSINKSTPTTTLTPGGTIVYTIVVSNTGSVNADGTVVSDPIAAGLTGQSWSCAASGGAVCPNAVGAGTLNETLAVFPAGSAVTYTVTATVSANPPAHVINTATVTPPTGSVCTPNNTQPPCHSTVTVPPVPQVNIQKSTPATTLTPGGTIVYTIVASNTGTVDAGGTVVADPTPTGIASQTWSCSATGGAACPNASGSGNLNETLATFPAGATVTYTVTATISANPPAQVINTATATPPHGGVCTPNNTAPPCGSTVVVPPVPQINIQKSTPATTLTPGGQIVYTIVASNSSAVDASGTVVADPIPAGIASQTWTCTASGGAACPNVSGTGSLSETLATFPAGSEVTYTVTATVSANPPAQVTNTATATPPKGGLCTPGNNAPPCGSTVVVPPVPQVNIQKSTTATTLTPGGTIVYTIVASNTGTVDAGGTVVADPMPTGIASQTWSCSATGGAACANASGSGSLNETLATFPAGATVTYTVTATVSANPPAQVINTATATPPHGGVCTPNNTAPPCGSTVVVPPVPQINIQKSTPATTLTPGGQIVYTIVASNSGAVDASGTVVADPIPAGIASQTWTCTASGGAACPNVSGTGSLSETLATFPAGATVTYTVTATVSANPPAQVINTATATPHNGVCTPGNTAPPCGSTVIVPPVPQINIQKSTPATTLTPGGQIVYTIVASNTGAVDASGTVVADPIPAGIASQAWTCAASGGAACPNPSGSGNLSETIAAFPAGSTVTYTVTATVSATPPAQVTNTATASPPKGGVCTPNNTAPPCGSTVIVPPVPQVGIVKTANTTTLTPGGTIVYTIVASNTGSVDAAGTVVADPIPAGIASQTWTCSAVTGGASCPNPSGSGALNETLAIFPAGSTVTYTVTATVSATPPAHVTNTATATPPHGGVCTPGNTAPPCGSTVIVPPYPQVSIQKSTPATTLTPNGTIVYTIVASNTGAVDAAGTVVADPIPAGIASQAWTCVATGGAACPNPNGNGALSETLATFPAGGVVTYTVTATVDANPPSHVINTATATPPTGSVCTPDNTPPPCHSTVTVPPVPQVSILKSTPATTLTPGGTIVYTIVASNVGSVSAAGTQVSDPIPNGIASQTWACAASGGAVCPNASGSGALNETLATFPAGGTATYTVTATIGTSPPAHVTNTATATPPTGSVCEPNNTQPPCNSTVIVPPVPQIGITKTASTSTLIPGGTVVYTVVVTNTGSVDADNTVVSDPIPAGIASQTWTCSASGGGVCPKANGSGALNETLLTFDPGNVVTYTVTATVSANPPAQVINTATATPPSGGVCTPGNTTPPCSATVTGTPVPQVSIAKSTSATTLTPNGTIVYTVVASNGGAVDASGTQVSDPIPAGITAVSWTCAAGGGAACPHASGSGALNETVATFPAGGSVTYTLTATVSATPPAHVTNTATTVPPGNGLCLPNNTPPPCGSIVVVPPVPQVSIAKTANTQTLTPGGTIVYTVVASNGGAVDASGTQVSDPIPAGIAAVSWTCTAAGGAVCPNASGSGALNETIGKFPAGGSVTYTLTATVSANPPAQVTNTATTTPPGNGLCLPNNTPPPCGSIVVIPPVPQVSINKTANTQTLTPGGTIVYAVVASNSGAVDASGTQVSDPIPAGITAVSWTCTAAGGAVCPNASGSGALNETIGKFPAGGSVTYTLTATVSATPPAHVTNTATTVPPGNGLCLPNNTPPPCGSIVVTPPVPQVSIQKSTTATTLTPNGTLVYTIVASNTGSVGAAGTVVSDPMPTGIASQTWTCSVAGGAVCPHASGSGNLSETLATFPAGSTVTYTVTATATSTPPPHVTNTATATPPTGSVCTPGNTLPPCTSTVVVPPVPQVSVTKTANTPTLNPGGTIVYTVTVANTGTVPANNTQVSDPIATGLASYSTTCAASGGAVCPNGAGPYTGALNETIATLPVGGSVVYTVTATVSAAPAGAVTNTVSVTPPGGGLCAPNNTPPPCTSTTTSSPPNVFDPPFITKSAKSIDAQTLLWTIVVDNNHNQVPQNLEIRDPMPASMSFVSGTLTCTAFGSTTISQCVFDAANNRIVVDTLMQSDFGVVDPATGPNRIAIVFQARFVSGPVAVTNIASACWDPQNNTTNVSTCAQAVQGSAQYTPPPPGQPPVPAPIDARWMLALLAFLYACQALRRLPRKRQAR